MPRRCAVANCSRAPNLISRRSASVEREDFHRSLPVNLSTEEAIAGYRSPEPETAATAFFDFLALSIVPKGGCVGGNFEDGRSGRRRGEVG